MSRKDGRKRKTNLIELRKIGITHTFIILYFCKEIRLLSLEESKQFYGKRGEKDDLLF